MSMIVIVYLNLRIVSGYEAIVTIKRCGSKFFYQIISSDMKIFLPCLTHAGVVCTRNTGDTRNSVLRPDHVAEKNQKREYWCMTTLHTDHWSEINTCMRCYTVLTRHFILISKIIVETWRKTLSWNHALMNSELNS